MQLGPTVHGIAEKADRTQPSFPLHGGRFGHCRRRLQQRSGSHVLCMGWLLPGRKHSLFSHGNHDLNPTWGGGVSLTVSSLSRSMLGAGTDVGVCRPRVVTPFWSRETLSLPFTLRLGLNIWEQWLRTLPVRLFQGVAVELARLLKASP